MAKIYFEKILKQIREIYISLFLLIWSFAMINVNKVLSLILFSLLISISLYKLVLIKGWIQEIQASEKKLINCYNDLPLKEKKLYIENTYEDTLAEDKKEDVITTEKQILEDTFNYVMEEDIKEEVASEVIVKDVPEDIKKYIRKLPLGKKASQKAIDLAKVYGYELKEGETFINPNRN